MDKVPNNKRKNRKIVIKIRKIIRRKKRIIRIRK